MNESGSSDNILPAKGKPDNRTVAQKRRAEYQEQQREYLRGLGLIEKISQDCDGEIDIEKLPEIKFKTETRLKLLSKILPDLKENAVTGENGGEVELFAKIVREVIDG